MSKEQNSEESGESPQRRLLSWPLALIAITLVLLFFANSVSAWGRRGNHDVEEVKEHIEHALDRMLDRVEATDAQAEQIEGIVFAAVDDLHAQIMEHREARNDREAVRALITAPTIDRDAFEAIRQSHLDSADALSLRLADTLADVLEVLTPEQRAELEAEFAKRHERHRRGFFGRGHH